MYISDLYKIFTNYPIISTDSRKIIRNSIFFALKGDNFDGNKFAPEALTKGAVYVIIDNKDFYIDNRCILVDNVLSTLQQLANYHRQQLRIPVIAITGTNGKTTTKELLHAVLSKKYVTVATQGNLNNHIGVPITLLSIPYDCEMAIIEMGANHIGEIDALCNIAMPNYGIITNIGKAHLEGFGSFEGVIKAKTELYSYVNNNQGSLFYNYENEILSSAIYNLTCKKISYGVNLHASYSGSLISSDPYLRCTLNYSTKEPITIQTSLAGTYNLENVLAASAVGMYFKVPIVDISNAIGNYQPSNSRSQLKFEKTNIILCDYYNANPSSMEVALKNFFNSTIEGKEKIVVLGAMKELGINSKDEHEKLLKMLEYYEFKKVFLVGNEFLECNNLKYDHFIDSESLLNHLIINKLSDSYILVKGSRATKLEMILESLKG